MPFVDILCWRHRPPGLPQAIAMTRHARGFSVHYHEYATPILEAGRQRPQTKKIVGGHAALLSRAHTFRHATMEFLD